MGDQEAERFFYIEMICYTFWIEHKKNDKELMPGYWSFNTYQC